MDKKSLSIYQQAFKAYDIRNLYEEIIDEPFAFLMWKAMGNYLLENSNERETKFLIWWDTRPANNQLMTYFVAGMEEVGYYDVVAADYDPKTGYSPWKEMTFGVCSSSVMYYLWRGDFDMGCTFTASHNSSEYVGMKFFDKKWEFLASDLLQWLFEVEYERTEEIPDDVSIELKNSLLISHKKEALFSLLEEKYSKLNKFHQFAVDFSNGAWVTVERDFLDEILVSKNHRIHFLNDVCDGTFPAHNSDTVVEKYFDQLKAEVMDNWLEFGVMFDGDADRVWFVSNSGKYIAGDVMVAIIAKQLMEQYTMPNSFDKKVVYDVMSTRAIIDKVKELWGEPVLCRVGRKFINDKMREVNALFGGELSGHYMFAELWGCELVLLAIYYVIKESENFNSFDEMIQEYTGAYYKWPCINQEVTDKDGVLEAIALAFADYKPERLDGINIYGDNFFITARKSNTEPIIRMVIEASSEGHYMELYEKLMGVVEEFV